jgi:hydroxyacylglutathione hydrolase
MFFTGDFIFVGDIGRPDLLEKAAGLTGTMDAGAKQMFQSIQRAAKLPDHIQLWPGHGAGSACGKALGAVPSSTIGYEKIRNWAFRFADDQEGFIRFLLQDQPEPPKYFAMMKKLNKVNRPLLTEVPSLKRLTVGELFESAEKGMKIIDTRNKADFALGFIPGSINIQGNNSFATWAGWLLSYDEPFILVAEENTLNDLTRKLMRIGLDNIYGYVPGVEDWEKGEGSLHVSEMISLEQLNESIQNNNLQLVDLRGATEFNSGHIKGAKHVFVGTLEDNIDKIDPAKNIVIHCQGGDRAAIGYSLLRKNGFENIKNFTGGINEWTAAGKELITK